MSLSLQDQALHGFCVYRSGDKGFRWKSEVPETTAKLAMVVVKKVKKSRDIILCDNLHCGL